MINDKEHEDVQSVSEDNIIEDANDMLKSNHEETCESENISGRL